MTVVVVLASTFGCASWGAQQKKGTGIGAAGGAPSAPVIGHTDSDGSDSYNQQLSERRGRSAEEYLTSLKVASSRLVSSGRGEAEPITSNGTEEGRRQNRRVEVAIYANDAWREEAKRVSSSR